VDFRERELNFREADRRYAELVRQLDAGNISEEEFDAQRRQLTVQDGEGRWWAKFGESGEWHYRDGDTWVPGIPPAYQGAVPKPTDPPAQTQSPSPSKDVKNEKASRRKVPAWILVIGLGGIALVGIVLVVWVLVPYLRGEQEPGAKGGGMLGEQDEPAPAGAAFDTVFIQRATPENISANSTYIDNPLTNGDPNVIIYVTQNWNPGGGTGTYNDHPVGVWYDPSAQRWAIFNQDRQAMPEGAAFNVAVLQEPTEPR
jgi:hypothetical protein